MITCYNKSKSKLIKDTMTECSKSRYNKITKAELIKLSSHVSGQVVPGLINTCSRAAYFPVWIVA
jgi:hypothetical protein